MGKNNSKVSVARLEERIINMQETLKELKEMIVNIRMCGENNEKEVADLKGRFGSHIDVHKSDLVKLGIFISIVVIIINVVLRLL